jgi:hypothetical protein
VVLHQLAQKYNLGQGEGSCTPLQGFAGVQANRVAQASNSASYDVDRAAAGKQKYNPLSGALLKSA